VVGFGAVAGNYDSTVATDYKHCGCRYEDPIQEQQAHASCEWTRAHVSPISKRVLAAPHVISPVNLATGSLLVPRAGPMLASPAQQNVSSSTWGWYAILCLLLLLLHCPTRGLRPGSERRGSSC
jgi:hypothetical protein